MRTRSLLAALVLAPTLAAGQVPVPQPEAPRSRAQGGRGTPRTRAVAPTTPRFPTPTPARPVAPAVAPSVPGSPPGPPGAQAPPSATTTRGDARCQPIQGRFLLSFNKADVVDVLEQASRWTCRNFIYSDDVAKGKITLLSKTSVTAEEAYAAFLAALSTNGIAVYQTGRYWKLVRVADAKKTPIPTYTGDGATPASEQPITKVIKLRYADADQVRGIMGNFISPQGADLQSIPPDTLIITDLALNIRRIERLIESVDQAGAGEAIKIVQVRYAPAKDVADKVNQVFQQQGGKGARRTVLTAPAVPGRPAPAAVAGAVDVQITKVIPDDRTNKLIIVSDEKSFERIMELVNQLDVPTAEEGGIHVIFLKNAAAEDVANTLSNLAQGKSGKSSGTPTPAQPGLSRAAGGPGAAAAPQAGAATAELFTGDVKITADKTQNALVVQAGGADIVAVRRLIEKLDRPRRQVFVEAVIMEVNLRDDTSFGVGAHGAIPVSTKDGTGFIPLNLAPGRISTLGTLANVQSLVGLGGFLTGFAGPVSASLKDLGLNIPSLGVMVQALQTSSDVNVLSTPHILASDNEESEITVGQNVPFQQGVSTNANLGTLTGLTGTNANLSQLLGNVSSFIPVQRQPVELRLKIKPQINEGDNVRLQIDEQIEEIASSDPQLGPTTSKRSVKTNIVAKDQSTIVIGGLIQERATRSVKKIPFLGSLPIIGWLFRDTNINKTKTNLLLFLTPYIIRDEADYRRIYEKKRKEQQDFMEQFYGRRPGYEVPVDYSRKAGPFSHLHKDVTEETSRIENGGDGAPGERLISPPGGALPGPVPSSRRRAPADGALEAPGEAVEPPVEPDAAEPIQVQPEIPPAEAPPFEPPTSADAPPAEAPPPHSPPLSPPPFTPPAPGTNPQEQ